jgi:hypothetical protein
MRLSASQRSPRLCIEIEVTPGWRSIFNTETPRSLRRREALAETT